MVFEAGASRAMLRDVRRGDGARCLMVRSGAADRERTATWVARVVVAVVFVLNVQCALSFVLWPGSYVGGFELSGTAGEVAVRGIGVAFLMWNVTYPAVIVSPRRFTALYVVVLVQQLVGLVGELWILIGLPAGHEAIADSIGRFVAFDAAGLIAMAAAFVWLRLSQR